MLVKLNSLLAIVSVIAAVMVCLPSEAARRQKPSSSGPTATLSGSSADDNLVGTAASDVIAGLSGQDWLDGQAGDDVLMGGRDGDTFVLRAGGGHDVITDFVMTDSLATTDRIMFDTGGVYDGLLWLGLLGDGLVLHNSQNTATFTVHARDVNNDGIMDTVIEANADSITILNYAPSQLRGYILQGG
jgi:Ca2+-binding RTX toxin-like protein